ncbi:MAG: hypothetical protein EHM93_13740 [Bacteroidales bacterium]|nr:MAG: hypothetical protein EHM93_13740 [Bacteroidales bacterium]
MKKIEFAGILVILFMFFACINSNKNSMNSLKTDKETSENTNNFEELKFDSLFKLEKFKQFPEKFIGAGGCFTYDTAKVIPENYIFLTNTMDSAIISINGKDIVLLSDPFNSRPRINDSIQDAWKGHGINVILKLINKDEIGDEASFRGTLELSTKKSKIKFRVHGGFGN